MEIDTSNVTKRERRLLSAWFALCPREYDRNFLSMMGEI
jgi:hypothetical protein